MTTTVLDDLPFLADVTPEPVNDRSRRTQEKLREPPTALRIQAPNVPAQFQRIQKIAEAAA